MLRSLNVSAEIARDGPGRTDKPAVQIDVEAAFRIRRIEVDFGPDQVAVATGIARGQREHELAGFVGQPHGRRRGGGVGNAGDPGDAAAVQEELADLRHQLAHAAIASIGRLESGEACHLCRRAELPALCHADECRGRGGHRCDGVGTGQLLIDIDARITDLDCHRSFLPILPQTVRSAECKNRASDLDALTV